MSLTSSKLYQSDGTIINLNDAYLNINDIYSPIYFFRKMTNNHNELHISKILMNNPHPNIVRIYRVYDNCVDMELLPYLKSNTDFDKNILVKHMNEVRKYLHSLNISYIDWALHNIGADYNGNYKLFDFNCSGIYNNNEWVIEAPRYHNYIKSVKMGYNTPIDIDNYSFFINIIKQK